MGKLPLKRTLKLAEKEREGQLKAELHFYSKTLKNKKHRNAFFLRLAEKMLDRIDPLKVFAILTFTFLIKTGIEWSEILVEGYEKYKDQFPFLSFGWIVGTLAPEDFGELADTPGSEILQWLVSFSVAYIIVEHAGELIQAGGNVLSVAKGLIGALGGS